MDIKVADGIGSINLLLDLKSNAIKVTLYYPDTYFYNGTLWQLINRKNNKINIYWNDKIVASFTMVDYNIDLKSKTINIDGTKVKEFNNGI